MVTTYTSLRVKADIGGTPIFTSCILENAVTKGRIHVGRIAYPPPSLPSKGRIHVGRIGYPPPTLPSKGRIHVGRIAFPPPSLPSKGRIHVGRIANPPPTLPSRVRPLGQYSDGRVGYPPLNR